MAEIGKKSSKETGRFMYLHLERGRERREGEEGGREGGREGGKGRGIREGTGGGKERATSWSRLE